MEYGNLTEKIIGLAIDVHRELGPGLLENAYKQCLGFELKNANIDFILEQQIPVIYKGMEIDSIYRVDFLVENKIVIEIKSIEKIPPVHEAQILTYMRLAKMKIGLLINFNVNLLKDGIKRFIL